MLGKGPTKFILYHMEIKPIHVSLYVILFVDILAEQFIALLIVRSLIRLKTKLLLTLGLNLLGMTISNI